MMMTRKSDLNTNVFMSHAHPSPEKLPTPEAVGGTLVFSSLFWGIAWVLVFVSFLTILHPLHAIRNATGFLVPLIAPVMVLEYLFRRFFSSRRFFWWIALSVVAVAAFGYANFYIFKKLINDPEAESNTVLAIVVFFLIYRGILFFFHGAKQQLQLNETLTAYAQSQAKLKAIEAAKTLAELNALRSQLNPHFLFNNLNNLFSLIETQRPNASRMVLMMSDILRHILETSRKELVTVAEEVRFLQNYIALEEIRLEDNCKIDLGINSPDTSLLMPPLLLLPLIENCFKHGISVDRKNNFVSIGIEADFDNLKFTARNYFDPSRVTIPESATAVGLRYLTRRLQTLPSETWHYAANPEGSVYVATLTIQLTRP